jgi:putative flippase GtrA
VSSPAVRPRTGQPRRFLIAGVLSALVDVAALVAFRDVVALPLWLATVLALSVTLAVNFLLNALWVFGARGMWASRAGRYGVMVVLNYVLTTVIVVGLAFFGLWYVAAKVVSLAVCAVVNFLGFRFWVFAAR